MSQKCAGFERREGRGRVSHALSCRHCALCALCACQLRRVWLHKVSLAAVYGCRVNKIQWQFGSTCCRGATGQRPCSSATTATRNGCMADAAAWQTRVRKAAALLRDATAPYAVGGHAHAGGGGDGGSSGCWLLSRAFAAAPNSDVRELLRAVAFERHRQRRRHVRRHCGQRVRQRVGRHDCRRHCLRRGGGGGRTAFGAAATQRVGASVRQWVQPSWDLAGGHLRRNVAEPKASMPALAAARRRNKKNLPALLRAQNARNPRAQAERGGRGHGTPPSGVRGGGREGRGGDASRPC
eukprot:359517-Chlamydomonas_euryale.AAC.14